MNDSTSPSERDFKPGDQVMWGKIGPCGVAAVDGGMVWVRLPSGDYSTVLASALNLVAAHPIPSEPNTAWVDADGYVFTVWQDGTVRDYYGMQVVSEHMPGPFTRLVPEGSEREAAIREVVEFLITRHEYESSARVERHLLSGVDQ